MSVERTEIERWILKNLSPRRSSSAELLYERMESQSGERLAVIYGPLDHTNRGHWHDVGIVTAFGHAVRKADVVLDVGPGDGWPALRIADRFEKVVGIDPSPRRVRVQKENAKRLGIRNVEFLEMDVTAMSFDEASFDGVVAASSVEQSDDPRRALEEIFRVLKPRGVFATDFEDFESYFPDSDGDEEFRAEASREEAVLFYQCRRKSPPRECWYALFLDVETLRADPKLSSLVDGLTAGPFESSASRGREGGPLGLPSASVLDRFKPMVREAKYFELAHLTSGSMDAMLADVGFVGVRHFDGRLPALRAVFNVARDSGVLDTLGPMFVTIAETFGIQAVELARSGPGSFVIAEKPS